MDTSMNWVISYPKSGNTWVRLLLASFMEFTGRGRDFCRYDDLPPYFYRAVSAQPTEQLNPAEMAGLRPAVIQHMMTLARQPLAIKSHHRHATVSGMPLFAPAWTQLVFYVVRDPRDVAPSLADHLGYTLDEAVEMMADPDRAIQKEETGLYHLLGTWSQHVRGWTEQDHVPDQHRVDVHTVRFRDLKDDAGYELEQMVEALGLEVQEEAITKAVERCELENLREQEDRSGYDGKSRWQDRFFREGKVGGWTDQLSDKHREAIEDEHGEMMSKLGMEIGARV